MLFRTAVSSVLMPSLFTLPIVSALMLTGAPAHAQSDAFLYVGANKQQTRFGAGSGQVSAQGVTASGLYALINATSGTTDFRGLSAFGTGVITVTGGTFRELATGGDGKINLIGTNLTQSATFQNLTGTPFYTVSGILAESSTPFTAQYNALSTGTLEFDGIAAVPGGAPVPEASTLVSLALLLLGGGGLALKRRKARA